MVELVQQDLNKFNEQSFNTIRLKAGNDNTGDRTHDLLFKEIDGLVRRRDPEDRADIATKKLSQLDLRTVKVGAGTYPLEVSPGDFQWIEMNPKAGGVMYGETLARTLPQDQLNIGIAAAVAALTQKGAPTAPAALDGVLLDISGNVGEAAIVNPSALNDTASMFSDAAQSIRAWVMHGLAFHVLLGDALKNAERLFTYETVSVYRDNIGRVYIVTDSPSLVNGETFHTLGLTENGIVIEDNQDFYSTVQETTGKANIVTEIQSQWSYNVRVKGHSYVDNNRAPSDAQIATPANWNMESSDVKSTAGVLLKHRIKTAA